eukprot:jgi/Psemu1/19519/gm1.19519_g
MQPSFATPSKETSKECAPPTSGCRRKRNLLDIADTPPRYVRIHKDGTTPLIHHEFPDLASLFPSFDQALATFLHNSFDVPKESNSILCEALIASQYRTWSDFLFIEDIDDLTYQDGGAREYWSGIVKASRDSTANRVVATHGTPPDGSAGRSTKPINQLKYESWTRKSRDETTFPVLQNDARFEHWLVKFKVKLETSDINTRKFLDPNWPATLLTGYPKALHDKQCAFFWTLLRHVFQGDFSSWCVLYHQRTRDGCQAYFDFVEFHNPVSPPTPPAAPVVSSPGPVPVRPPAIGNIVTPRPTPPVSPLTSVPIPSSTPTVHQSTPTSACETDVHSTVDNPATPTGLPGHSNPGSTADSTSTGTPSYTWKYFPRTDSVRFTKIDSSSTLGIVPTDTPPHFTRTSKTSPANSRWTFYPQSETVVFHRARSAPQPSCISSLQLPPSGASSNVSVVSSSVRKPLYGASFCPVWKPSAYPVQKPLYGAHSMNDSPAVCITKRHRDAIKLKLYHLHATLLFANWIYDGVT